MSIEDPLAWLEAVAHHRLQNGLHRQLRPRVPHSGLIDLASNDYLGLTQHPDVIAAAVDAVHKWGTGSTGSRLVTGSTTDHEQLEGELAEFVGAQAGLVFATGYAANLAAVTALADADTLVISDAHNHASIIDGCRLSRARLQVVAHNDTAAVARFLASRTEAKALVVTESVFSTDGDLAPLNDLHSNARRYGAVLVVDEAHAIGVRGHGGRGLVHEVGLAGTPDVVITATLSKSLAAQGGAVLGSEKVRSHLINAARTFIFDTGLAPAAVGAALAALRVLRRHPEMASQVLANAATIARIAHVDAPPSAVVPVVLGEPDVAYAAAQACWRRGLNVGCFRPPSVPAGTSRLRITARADLSENEMAVVETVLGEVFANADVIRPRQPQRE
ncbi:8-amino-7-oxononanoate synthase [Mycolicibacterium setense]|uniref:8-amino-7-oxononanoate synthase n=1 Tax=Mycolicibacterium setense TaxID=431269 RepID=UPI0005758C50|nr:8-amino-7-oxononanoate synthase [Mycolicibacterium setense]KHO22073.1 8-amino-7-oxononanoate synthase [Mycolicibacterium setense]MCV7113695.1 8-amino-7-oxononanoate synthase [Mycolicibacterium setense]